MQCVILSKFSSKTSLINETYDYTALDRRYTFNGSQVYRFIVVSRQWGIGVVGGCDGAG